MRIAMLLHKSVEHDSRVRREARALAAAGHEVTVLHLPRERGEFDGVHDGFAVRSVTPPAWVRRRLPTIVYRLVFLLAFVRAAWRRRAEAVHANDVAMLAPGWLAARLLGARLVYDSHELASGVPYREERIWAFLVAALERALIGRCDAVITVSDGIADRLQRRYGLDRRPTVVRNLPDPAEHDPGFEAPDLRASLGAPAEAMLVLHLGAVARDRGCENLIRAIAELDDAHLLFLGADDDAYAAGLRQLAATARVADRVHFRPSVPVGQIRAHTRQASVGVTLLEDTCENHRLALPNKVFEYLEAGVPVLASDLPELRALVEREGGATADPSRPEPIAAGLRRIVDQPPATPRAPRWGEESCRLRGVYESEERERSGVAATILVRNPVTHDARVMREARLLSSLGHRVRILGAAASETEVGPDTVGGGFEVTRLPSRPRLGWLRAATRRSRGEAGARPGLGVAAAPAGASGGTARRIYRLLASAEWNRRALFEILRERPRLIHCNDYNTMWVGVAARLIYGSRLVYDSHELWPDRNLRVEWRPGLLAGEALFVRLADRTITTSPGYAREMARRYRVAEPAVVRNIPDTPPRAGGAPPDRGLVVYFGALTLGRGLEEAVTAIAELPGVRLRLVGPQAWSFRTVLESLSRELGVEDRVELLDPVPPESAATVMADADAGLALIQPTCLSYRLTLPNKLFEYALAGLPVLATDLSVMAELLDRHRLGIAVPAGDHGALVAGLREILDPEVNARLRRSVAVAQGELSWEAESARLEACYRDALGSGT